MDFEYNKHNVIKYLPTNKDKDIWEMSISGVGFQSVKPKYRYPIYCDYTYALDS